MCIAASFIGCLLATQPIPVATAAAPDAPAASNGASKSASDPSDPAVRPLPLRVTVSVDLDAAYDEDLAAAIRVAAVDAALASGRVVLPDEPTAGAHLGITVRWSDPTAGDIRVDYRLDAGAGAGAPRSFVRTCETCDAAMLVEKMRGELGRVLAVLDTPPPSRSAPAVDAAVPAARPSPTSPRGLSRLGWAGVGVAAAAAAPLAAGIALVVRGEVFVGPGKTPEYLEYKNYRPAGYALLGVAAGMLVTGVVVIVVDRVRARRATRGAPAQQGIR
jgi:hypothetical protein